MNVLAIKAAVGLVLIGSFFFTAKGCVDNYNEMILAKAAAADNAIKAQKNFDELKVCEAVNEENAGLLLAANARAEEAVERVAELEAEANASTETIAFEEHEMRENAPESCYRLDEPYPDDFIDWLRS